MSNLALFCPPLGIYAAIRMDPAAMVEHLDAQALEEAQAMHPKTYLVYLHWTLALPFPGQSWYGYSALPVGPSLRAIDEARGFESDMCIPIFPNEAHPCGRPPVPTNPVFPYDNCYHWAGLDLKIRVKEREEGFDQTHAVALPGRKLFDLETLLSDDGGRAKRTRLARQHASPDSNVSVSGSIQQPGNLSGSRESDIYAEPEGGDPEYLPLVNLWVDLAANLKQEDIGDPIDFFRERHAITSIIRNAHARDPDLPTLREYIALHRDPYIGGSDCESDVSDMDSDCVSDEGASEHLEHEAPKPKRFRPLKLIRKLRTRGRSLLTFPRIRIPARP